MTTTGNVILVPIDHSAITSSLVTYAAKMATASHKTLYFIYVIDPSRYTSRFQSFDLQTQIDREKALAAYNLENVVNEAHHLTREPVINSIICGDPRRTIVRLSNLNNVIETIIGAQGKDADRYTRIGHVTRYVSSWSQHNVTIIKPNDPQPQRTP